MNSSLRFALCLAGISVMLSLASVHADDWKTTDGKVYQNVSVVKAEPDAVTILHKDGGARVPLASLSPDLQKKFNYDPAKAKAAADVRTQADVENAKALQAEMDLARDQKQAMLIATDRRVQNGTLAPIEMPSASASEDPLATPTDSTHHSLAMLKLVAEDLGPDLSDPAHHTIARLIDSMHNLGPDPNDPSHHSTGQLIASMHNLGPDPNDPSHHSIASLVASMHNLGPDPNDPKHHTMDQLFGSDPLARP